MKSVRFLTLLALFGLFALPLSALAQLHLTWDNCPAEPAAALNENLDCSAATQYKLHATFTAPRDMTGFFAMDVRIDLYRSTRFEELLKEPLHPFWHFETGGCNESGLALSADKSLSGGCVAHISPWGEHGEQTAFADINVYGADVFGQPGHGVVLASVTRKSNNPFPIHAGTDYYAFHLLWSTGNASACAGCTDRILVYLNALTLYSDEDGYPLTVQLMGSGPCSDCGPHDITTINGPDYPVPVTPTSWGQIKSQYR